MSNRDKNALKFYLFITLLILVPALYLIISKDIKENEINNQVEEIEEVEEVTQTMKINLEVVTTTSTTTTTTTTTTPIEEEIIIEMETE